MAILPFIGILFMMPQYFQGVHGADGMGSGLRLLPLIGGLVVGAVPADRVVDRVGAKLAAAAGFVLLAGGLFLGATTTATSSDSFVACWMVIAGTGMGLALATVSSAALVELSEERSGVGAAVQQAVNKVGWPFGTAILGSVLSSVLLARLDVSELPASAATAARQSIFGAVAVAHQVGSASLLESAQTAFAHGMDAALVVSAGIALAGAILTLIYLPLTNESETSDTPDTSNVAETSDATETPDATETSDATMQARSGTEEEIVRTQ